MNILLVDDQPEVLSGIMIGVDWNNLNIDEVHKAYNIFEAQSIIKNNKIDIMLCDIEMPLGTGLELYEWVNEEEYNIKCIFLTAHSDFQYAQQAVKLQGFDYLLQPVTYQQIENSVKSAVEKAKTEKIMDTYYQYGKLLKKREDFSVNSTLRDYILGYSNSVEKIVELLGQMSFEIKPKTKCCACLIQILNNTGAKWDNELFWYAINNVMKELMDKLIEKMVLVSMDNTFYYLIYVQNPMIEEKDIFQSINTFIDICRDYFGCKCAVYEAEARKFDSVPEAYSKIKQQANNNVTCESKMFTRSEIEKEHLGYSPPDFSDWDLLISQNCYDSVYTKSTEYIYQQTKKGNMNSYFLKHFHQDYMCWFFHELHEKGIRAHDVFPQDDNAKYDYNALMNAYTSVERIKTLLAFTLHYLKEQTSSSDEPIDRIDEVISIIHENIQKNISRKDLAEAVFLNPEYLSRLFKKEKGCTMSDFILKEKMNVAKALLETTNFSVSIIASKVGYCNFSHFAQCFKKEFSVSPSEFRQKIK